VSADDNERWGIERLASRMRIDQSPHGAAAYRLAAAVRLLVDRTVGTEASTEMLEQAAEQVRALADEFAAHRQRDLYESFAETANAGRPSAFFDRSPVVGGANALAPPMTLEVVDGMIIGRVRFGTAYEGPPGYVHGGFVAAAFDDVLGLAQSLSNRAGMTGTLTVRYRRPTPLHADLVFEGRLVSVEGRKILTEGVSRGPDGEVTAEAEALFVTVDFERMAELKRARLAREEQERGS